ncbi:hypothetical protein KIN20_023479 [Parelaphostrongylus tenuis]|uniref:Uncharacterized protein n=1 Tax=Parelaphostrongylus tenuis TaxID=148309 RepID=A0AAD5QVE6_PARTN|nr:hypothetical protein KIN20_023479 [Parelaphostrongylus tenuis]
MISMYSYPIKKNDTLLQRALVPSPSSFTLPVAMVYTGDSTISTQVFGTANNKGGDQALVNCLVMQVFRMRSSSYDDMKCQLDFDSFARPYTC